MVKNERTISYCDTRTAIQMNGRDFNILTLTDTHLDSEEKTILLEKLLSKAINQIKPQLVVFLGDNIQNADFHFKYLERICEFLERKKQYWTAVLGNHDRDGLAGLKRQSDLLTSFGDRTRGKYCLYKVSERDFETELDWNRYKNDDRSRLYPAISKGRDKDWYTEKYGNYTVSVESDGKVVYSLVFLDSGQHNAPSSIDNGYIEGYQVDFYRNHIKRLSQCASKRQDEAKRIGQNQCCVTDVTKEKFVPNMLFFHQPIYEYALATKDAFGGEGMRLIESGTALEVPNDRGFGTNGEKANLQHDGINTGLFACAKEMGCTHMFCGHDHDNNSTIFYNGIYLSYGCFFRPITGQDSLCKVITIGKDGLVGLSLKEIRIN